MQTRRQSIVGAGAGPLSPVAVESGERRRQPRHRVLWPGRLRFPDNEPILTCTVANISAGGAKITHAVRPGTPEGAAVAAALEPGRPVCVSVNELGELPARIVWCGRGRLGVRFTDPPDAVARALAPTLPLA